MSNDESEILVQWRTSINGYNALTHTTRGYNLRCRADPKGYISNSDLTQGSTNWQLQVRRNVDAWIIREMLRQQLKVRVENLHTFSYPRRKAKTAQYTCFWCDTTIQGVSQSTVKQKGNEDIINKFITNKYHLSMNREPLLHVSAIVYNHLHGPPIYI
jgi:hypothetical protein